MDWVITVSYVGFLLFGVARFAANWRRTVRLRRASYPRALPEPLSTIAQRSFAANGVRPATILCSPQLAGPAIAGVSSPVLLLPEPFFERVEEDDFASAISHELAHIRRRDFFSNLVCEFALLPIAFHPGAVLIKKGIDRSRELACDESAARNSSTPSAYARSLLNLAGGMQTAIASAPHNYSLGLFDSDTLEERIVNLLRKPNQFSKKLGHISTALASSVLVLVCVAASAFSVQVAPAAKAGGDLQPFVGTWQAKFNGKVFQTVVIETKDGKLTGTVTHGSVQMNDQGEMTGAELKEGSDPITAYKLEGKVLHLTVTGEASVNADGTDTKLDTTNFEMTVAGKDDGTIIPVDDDIKSDMPAMKPWKLERVKK
jgi:beta-lactamase regulating signal transducer with metallopeptidase domain